MTRAEYVDAARTRADLLYRGEAVAHRSCGIALAETFGLPSASYQALRRGGLTGQGTCGALHAGLLVLGELLGDRNPAGPPTAELKAAAVAYRAWLAAELPGTPGDSCNSRTREFPDFTARPRALHCTALAASAAAGVAGVLWDLGRPTPLPAAPTR